MLVLLYREMLSMGSSKPWPEAMKVMTGKSVLNATAFVKYFEPLMEYLEEEVRNRSNLS